MGPRDEPVRFAVPVNYETGRELTTHQQMHLVRITEAADALRDAMHAAEGSTPPGDHQEHVFLSRRMNIAATHIETIKSTAEHRQPPVIVGRPFECRCLAIDHR